MSKIFTTTVTDVDKQTAHIDIEISDEASKEMFVAVSNKLSKEHKIEGFRPGMAPFGIVSQHLGMDFVLNKVMDHAFQKTYVKAITDSKVDFWGMPQLAVTKIAHGNPITYRMTVNKRPEIKVPDLKKIKVKAEKQSVTDKEVEQALDQLQKSRAQFVTVSRAAKKSDRVEIDFDAMHDGKPVEGSAAKNYPVIIGESQLVPGFDDQLIGMKAEEEKEFELDMPKQGVVDQLAGQKIQFKAKMHVVQERKLPELNDEFITSLGQEFKTLTDLKKSVKEGMLAEKDRQETQRQQLAILEAIAEKVKVDIPDQILDQEVDHDLNHMKQDLAGRGVDWNTYLEQVKKSEDDLKKTIRPQSQKRIIHALILDSAGRDQNIKVTKKEIDAELEAFRTAQVGRPFDEEQIKSQIMRSLRNQKIFEYLQKSITTN